MGLCGGQHIQGSENLQGEHAGWLVKYTFARGIVTKANPSWWVMQDAQECALCSIGAKVSNGLRHPVAPPQGNWAPALR